MTVTSSAKIDSIPARSHVDGARRGIPQQSRIVRLDPRASLNSEFSRHYRLVVDRASFPGD